MKTMSSKESSTLDTSELTSARDEGKGESPPSKTSSSAKRPSVSDSVAASEEGQENFDDSSSLSDASSPKKKKRRKRKDESKPGLQERWDEMFNRLREFKRTHGHCLVPNRYADDPSLGAWVSTQRRQYKILTSGSSESTPMTPERASRLLSIGFVWATKDPRHVPWETRFRELCDFKNKFGHCLVPIGYKANVQLSNWVSTQRQEFKLMREGRTTRMTPERVQALEAIGFVWEAQRGGPRRKSINRADGSYYSATTQETAEAAGDIAGVQHDEFLKNNNEDDVARDPGPPQRGPTRIARSASTSSEAMPSATIGRGPPPPELRMAVGVPLPPNNDATPVDPALAAQLHFAAGARAAEQAMMLRAMSANPQEQAALLGAAHDPQMLIQPVVVPVPVPVVPGVAGLLPPFGHPPSSASLAAGRGGILQHGQHQAITLGGTNSMLVGAPRSYLPMPRRNSSARIGLGCAAFPARASSHHAGTSTNRSREAYQLSEVSTSLIRQVAAQLGEDQQQQNQRNMHERLQKKVATKVATKKMDNKERKLAAPRLASVTATAAVPPGAAGTSGTTGAMLADGHRPPANVNASPVGDIYDDADEDDK